VPRVLQQLIEQPRVCSYLPNERASLETRIMLDVAPAEFEAMLARGWRRFGPAYFRPLCEPCHECVPIRIPVARFKRSESQRRAWKNCGDLRVTIGIPRVDPARLDLYARWHAMREVAVGWDEAPIDAERYAMEFAFPHPCAREIAMYDDTAPGAPKLVGVGICDETPNAWSAVYFFYDPAYARRSLGVANVLFQIEYARRRGLAHVYLGYRVAECRSLQYKARFRPHELLVGRPSPTDTPDWRSPATE
jgi:arginine-tRNA-protein transferase